MTEPQYQEALAKYPDFVEEIKKKTVQEGNHKIVSYTQILTEQRSFYEYMESFEIYNGRVPLEDFKHIILSRYEDLNSVGNIFECSLFQNAIECMMLFYECTEDKIVDFYKDVNQVLSDKELLLLYLESSDIKGNILQIKKERCDDQGNEMWFPLMTAWHLFKITSSCLPTFYDYFKFI